MELPELHLERFLQRARATLGRLTYPGGACYTLEDPWLNNERFVSCVPEGRYVIERDTFKGLYPNYRLVLVPGRDAIEIHRGNTTSDTQGCILVGQRVMLFETGNPVLQSSTRAMNAFMEAMEGQPEAALTIWGAP